MMFCYDIICFLVPQSFTLYNILQNLSRTKSLYLVSKIKSGVLTRVKDFENAALIGLKGKIPPQKITSTKL